MEAPTGLYNADGITMNVFIPDWVTDVPPIKIVSHKNAIPGYRKLIIRISTASDQQNFTPPPTSTYSDQNYDINDNIVKG